MKSDLKRPNMIHAVRPAVQSRNFRIPRHLTYMMEHEKDSFETHLSMIFYFGVYLPGTHTNERKGAIYGKK